MAGHSKWAKVKHFKGAMDARRGQIIVAREAASEETVMGIALEAPDDHDDVQRVHSNAELPETGG